MVALGNCRMGWHSHALNWHVQSTIREFPTTTLMEVRSRKLRPSVVHTARRFWTVSCKLTSGESMQIVCVGGGTGLPVLLRGLRQLAESRSSTEERITPVAVVCVSDNGGSSGFLRSAFGIPAVGDLRNCLVALSEENNRWSELFQHRLHGFGGAAGHPLGNLVVAAFCERTGSFREAVRQAAELLH